MIFTADWKIKIAHCKQQIYTIAEEKQKRLTGIQLNRAGAISNQRSRIKL